MSVQNALDLLQSYLQAGRFTEAEAVVDAVLKADPTHSRAHYFQGYMRAVQQRWADALPALQKALEGDPQNVSLCNDLTVTLAKLYRLEEAEAVCRRALQINPASGLVHNNLGMTLWELGRIPEARQAFAAALAIDPQDAVAHSNALCCMQYLPGVTPADLLAAHRQWDLQHAAPLNAAVRAAPPPERTGRPLRLGFVSGDFAGRAVGFFLIRSFENLARRACETFCYATTPDEDAVTRRFRAAATAWRNAAALSDAALDQQIRADGIDVLFDLAGHTAGNRLPVFARRPAPTQITWIGYEGTTGLAAMDYLLADSCQVPTGAERYYRERVLRMPESYVCFDPPGDAPPVGSLPATQPGAVTFACCNNPAKINAEVLDVWAAILRRLPAARLVLQFRGFDGPAARQRFRDAFVERGIAAGRVTLQGHAPHAEYLAGHLAIDIALDPFPFSGSLTTCNALWMGVPVITLPGDTFASRHTLNHLTQVGLSELAAGSPSAYVELAVALAHDLPRLATLRCELRQRMAAALCDGQQFADRLLTMVSEVHRSRPTSGSAAP